MNHPKMITLAGAIAFAMACIAGSGTAHAQATTHDNQQPGDDSSQAMQTVVVTATGYRQLVAEAPASISVITREDLKSQPFTNLQDAVGQVPGVSVTGADVNRSDISIRGMPGKYTLILVDGMRQSTRENSHRQVLGMAQSTQIPPLRAIRRIEVVRGPMSSLYGSDAIGGVVNVITRKPGDQWHGGVDLHVTAQEHSELGNARGADFYLGGPVTDDGVGFQLWGKLNDRTESQLIDGAFGTRDQGTTARLTLTPADHQQLLLEAGWHELAFHSSAGQTHIRPRGGMDLEYQRAHYSLRHLGDWSFGHTDISLYRESGQTHHLIAGAANPHYGSNEIVNTTLQGSVVLPLASHTLTVGGQYVDNDLSGTNHEGRNSITGIDNQSWSLFAEDTWRATLDLAFTGGIRFNHDARYGGHWSPRLYAVYHLGDQWTLRGGVARGFRAPGLRQTAADYTAITGVGHIGVPRGQLPGNPALEPETSTSTEIGLRYRGNNGLRAGVTLFNNDFKNKIFSECVLDCDGASGATYAWGNIGEARIRGAELDVSWPLPGQVTLNANYTWIHSERLTDEEYAFNGESLKGQPLARTPEHAVDIRANWQASEQLSTYFAIHSSSPRYWANFRNGAQWVRQRPGSTTYDIGMQYAFSDHITVRAALLNITDKRVAVDHRNRLTGLDGNWLVDDGRRLWVSLGMGF